MSWRSSYRAGAAALGVIIAFSMAAVVIRVAATGTGQVAVASVAHASVVAADSSMPVTHQVGGTAQRGALAHWTPQRMRAAKALPLVLVRIELPWATRLREQSTQRQPGPQITAPKGIPKAVPFNGSPTTGALFYSTNGKDHFCTASVVDSTAGDVVLTAAHCVYWKVFATNVEYVPGYHDGKQPYGAWLVAEITVASGWQNSHNPDLDFAFLTIAAAGGQQIQARTGGLTLGFTRWYSEKIEVIGHNDTDGNPIRCATRSFRYRYGQMEFYCHGFSTGTSGGPWIIGYNARKGTGTVFGVIGGYELGGDYEWASYSAYFGHATRILYQQVEHQSAPHPTPTTSTSSIPTPPPSTATGPQTPSTSSTTTAPLTTRAPRSAPRFLLLSRKR